MPYWPKTLNPHLPCATFLEAYPYPAFVLNKKQTGKLAASLIPIWSNSAYRYLVFGPKANEPQNIAGGGLLEALPGTGFEGLEEARKLANWVELLGEAADVPYLLELDPPWLPSDHPTIQLELTKTRIDPMWIITSTPRTPLPSHPPRPLVMDIPPEVARSTSFAIAPGPEPSHSGTESQSSRPTSPSPANPSRFRLLNPEKDPQRGFFTAGTQMLEYMRNYPWDTHVLGPMDSWPQSLKTTVGAVMSSPYPWALWWGPDLVLIYNDAYAVMAGTKHPQLFGQHGKIAWAEIWEEIGPLADIVMKDGKSIGYEDDRMFFDRLTDKRLPEEVYHSWTWIPVRVEGGKIGGMLNATTETTSKILYDRRIQILRSIGDKTALARSKAEFAEATQKVLTDDAQLDMPFVAFYFNTVDAPPKPTRTETTDYPPRPLALRVTSKLAYKIGVPDDHPAIPTRVVRYLDPITLKPRSIPPKRTGASPSSTVDASSLPDDTPTVVLSPPDVEEAEAEHPPTPEPQWPFFDIFSSKITLHIRSLPASIGEGFGYRPQGFNDVPREALIIPIAAEGDDVPVAVVIVGLNTRRPYDEEHRNWIDLLHMTLNSTLTAALGREAEVRKVEQLAQLDAAKTLFFSSASHELRTPLTLIAGPVDDAAEMTTEPRVKDLLKTSVRNIGRLSRLVDSLMDFSRLEAGRLVGRFKATNLADFTSDLASLFRGPIEKQGIEYLVTCDYADEATVYIDHDLWEKIVFNLIGNAFKYTLKGQVRIHIQYKTSHAQFIVSDTGVGIPSEDLERIFERFHRVPGVARSHEGTGIGLALTRELVKIHGGTIAVTSTVEDKENPEAPHGSTFTVSIPTGSDHFAPGDLDEEESNYTSTRSYGRGIVEEAINWSTRYRQNTDDTAPSESSESATNSNSDSSKSGELAGLFRFSPDDVLLVVDDNSDIRRFIRSIFRKYCPVIEAENALEGLQLMEAKRPSIVVSDVMMPGMDGLAFVNAIRERPSISWTPIVLLTARAGDEARVEGLLSGADDYIAKPFKSKELIARVHLHLHIGKRKQELQKLFDQRTREIKLLSDMSPVGIFRTDNQGQITYTNKRWHEITDYPPNQPFTDWILNVHPVFQKDVLNATTQVLHNNEGANLEIQWRNEKWTKLQIERVANGLIGTVTDISDRRLYEAAQIAQAKEREALAQLRAADAEQQRAEADERRRAQELLVDVTSHELRQPVSAIINCSQMVRTNLGNLADMLREARASSFRPTEALLAVIEEDLTALDSIYQCGLSQERIANDVLSLSRLQLDTLSIHSVDFHLIDELKRILSIFSNELRMKRIKLDIKLGDSVYVLDVKRVSSDRTRFSQIVTNLMSNAIKFTDISPAADRHIVLYLDLSLDPPAGDKCIAPAIDIVDLATIRRKVKTPGTVVYVYVAVQDAGPGLKPGDLSLLFQRFQQGSNSHEVFGGSGLGLFVSRKLCELMGGNIDVDSVYGQGATFRFFIQVKTGREIPNEAESATTSSVPSHVAPPTVPMGPVGPSSQTAYHILITEDNIINQTVLNRQLKYAGFTTELANNGKEALERVKKLALGTDNIDPALPRRFDAILMDCEMPVMDGNTATKEIRRLEKEGILPLRNRIIALTGNAREGQVEAALNAGMDDVVIKPYKIDELVFKIRDRATMD